MKSIVVEFSSPQEGGRMPAPEPAKGPLWPVTTVVLGLYFASLFMPAVYIDDGVASSDLEFKVGSPIGLAALLLGWSDRLSVIPWSANFFWFGGLVAFLS